MTRFPCVDLARLRAIPCRPAPHALLEGRTPRGRAVAIRAARRDPAVMLGDHAGIAGPERPVVRPGQEGVDGDLVRVAVVLAKAQLEQDPAVQQRCQPPEGGVQRRVPDVKVHSRAGLEVVLRPVVLPHLVPIRRSLDPRRHDHPYAQEDRHERDRRRAQGATAHRYRGMADHVIPLLFSEAAAGHVDGGAGAAQVGRPLEAVGASPVRPRPRPPRRHSREWPGCRRRPGGPAARPALANPSPPPCRPSPLTSLSCPG
mmetsp:Transcript_18167/g.41094  ORF Transcript_18167/g.41094 Transcript_18167/m.41094 type:complete len:258 (-) Transcript_18167:80-853(-)